MANLVDYTNVNWKDFPNTDTPVTATNLNIMDTGIANCAKSINNLNATEGASLSVSGQTVSLKNAAGSVLSSITTQDTVITALSQLTNDMGFLTCSTNESNYLTIGNIKICWGETATGAGQRTTNFPITFTSAPTVILSSFNLNSELRMIPTLNAVNTSYFNSTNFYWDGTNSGLANEASQYIAIGH